METNELEDEMIESYIIALEIIRKDINDCDNELNLSEFIVTCFICGNKGHKDNNKKEHIKVAK